MATTTNYSWTTPDDTALVKDGAAAIRTLGSSVDTTTKNLNPSTTLGDIEYRSSIANTNTRLGIGTTGQVLTVSGGVPAWATPATGFVGCRLFYTADASISNNTATILNFNSETFDTDSFHSTSTNTSRITIPSGKAGKYLINGKANWTASATGIRQVYIYLNNTTNISQSTLNSGAEVFDVSVSTTASLSVGDYIEFGVYQTSGTSRSARAGTDLTYFEVTYLGA
jgi:hypothetical protein